MDSNFPNVGDARIEVELSKVFSVFREMIQVVRPSHSDRVDMNNMSTAATVSSGRCPQRKKSRPKEAIKIDTVTPQVIEDDLIALKDHTSAVNEIFNGLMQVAEADGPFQHSFMKSEVRPNLKGDGSKEQSLAALGSVCSNNMIQNPFLKLQLFSNLIAIDGPPVERLGILLNTTKGSNAFWKTFPVLINTTADIIVKLYCVWIFWAAQINIAELSTRCGSFGPEAAASVDSNCLLPQDDPCVLGAIDSINYLLQRRKDAQCYATDAQAATASSEVRSSNLQETLSGLIIPLLSAMDTIFKS